MFGLLTQGVYYRKHVFSLCFLASSIYCTSTTHQVSKSSSIFSVIKSGKLGARWVKYYPPHTFWDRYSVTLNGKLGACRVKYYPPHTLSKRYLTNHHIFSPQRTENLNPDECGNPFSLGAFTLQGIKRLKPADWKNPSVSRGPLSKSNYNCFHSTRKSPTHCVQFPNQTRYFASSLFIPRNENFEHPLREGISTFSKSWFPNQKNRFLCIPSYHS